MSHPTFITLGPAGTCHENALRHYLAYQDIVDARIVLVQDLLEEGLEQLRREPNAFLVQCSAHVQVHLVTERYHEEVFVIDTFIYPTKELALIYRTDALDEPKSLGIVSATRGYLDLGRFERVVDEPSKPVVARKLLAGEYEAGLTHSHHAAEHPDELRLVELYGAVDTTWVVYGKQKRFKGEVIAQKVPWLYVPLAEPAGTL